MDARCLCSHEGLKESIERSLSIGVGCRTTAQQNRSGINKAESVSYRHLFPNEGVPVSGIAPIHNRLIIS